MAENPQHNGMLYVNVIPCFILSLEYKMTVFMHAVLLPHVQIFY